MKSFEDIGMEFINNHTIVQNGAVSIVGTLLCMVGDEMSDDRMRYDVVVKTDDGNKIVYCTTNRLKDAYAEYEELCSRKTVSHASNKMKLWIVRWNYTPSGKERTIVWARTEEGARALVEPTADETDWLGQRVEEIEEIPIPSEAKVVYTGTSCC
jgi:hypothetical protein